MHRAIAAAAAAAISGLSKDFFYLYQAQQEKEIQEKRKEKHLFGYTQNLIACVQRHSRANHSLLSHAR